AAPVHLAQHDEDARAQHLPEARGHSPRGRGRGASARGCAHDRAAPGREARRERPPRSGSRQSVENRNPPARVRAVPRTTDRRGVSTADDHELACSIARTLQVIGDRWALLILRDAFRGVRRFDEFASDLGIARNLLADRLARLVQQGILEKVPYSERPRRFEYRLTARGL